MNLFSKKANTPARVGHTTRVFELQRKDLIEKDYDSDGVFLLLLWCASMKKLIEANFSSDTMMCDEMAIEYYKTTERNIKSAHSMYLNMIKGVSSSLIQFSIIRLNRIQELLKLENQL